MTAYALTPPRPHAPTIRLFAILVNIGRRIITGKLLNSAPSAGQPGAAAPRYIGWGTANTAEAAAQTTLATEASEARVAGTDTQQTTSVTNDTYQVVGTMTADGTKTIQEAATFDASSSGNMFIRGIFTGIPVELNDQITFTFKLQIT